VRVATIWCDNHPAYRRVMRQIDDTSLMVRTTPSSARRTKRNRLFEVNLLDLLIRHSCANHKRETIAFSKRRQSSAERLAILQVWRNWIKKRSEKGPRYTPAMLKGLARRPWQVAEVLSQRLFRTKISLPPSWALYYDRLVKTRALSVNRLHKLKYAY
jgi:hypothetical protein